MSKLGLELSWESKQRKTIEKTLLLPPTEVAKTLRNTALRAVSGGKLAGETPVGVAASVIVNVNETKDSFKTVIGDSVSNSAVGDKDTVATTTGLLVDLGRLVTTSSVTTSAGAKVSTSVLVLTRGVIITSVGMTGATVGDIRGKLGSQGVTFMFRGPGDQTSRVPRVTLTMDWGK